MDININFDNKLVNNNGIKLNGNNYLWEKKTDDIVSIEYNFKDLPEEYKTYQMCIDMCLTNNNNLVYATEEFKTVSNTIKTASSYAMGFEYSLNDYLNADTVDKQKISNFVCQSIALKMRDTFITIFGPIDYPKFEKEMVRSQGVISGSSILQAFYGTNYSTDYDIFVNKTKCYDLLKLLKSVGSVMIDCDNYKDNKQYGKMGTVNKDNKKYSSMDKTYNGIKQSISTVISFNVNSYKVQVIVINEKLEPMAFIKSNFDIDICKNMYWYSGLVPAVALYNIDNLILKKASFENVKESSSDYRKQKYIGRDFVFNDETKLQVGVSKQNGLKAPVIPTVDTTTNPTINKGSRTLDFCEIDTQLLNSIFGSKVQQTQPTNEQSNNNNHIGSIP